MQAAELLERGFVEVSAEELRQCRNVMLGENVVRVASGIATAEMMGGGMQFSMGEKLLTGPLAMAYQHTWSKFATDVMRSLWMYGFVAVGVQPDAHLGAKPFALQLDEVMVLLKRSYDGRAQYVFFDTATALYDMNTEPKMIPNLTVYESDPPTSRGSLVSVARHVIAGKETLQHLEQAERAAVLQNSHPTVSLESTLPPQDLSTTLFSGSTDRPGQTNDQAIAKVMDEVARIRTHLGNTQNLHTDGTREARLYNLLQQSPATAGLANELSRTAPMRFLPRGYRLATGPQAQEPTNLSYFYEAFEEHVGALFYVPRSFWAQFSASRSGNNPDARQMFNTGQKYHKQLLVPILNSVFQNIHGEGLRQAQLLRTKQQLKQAKRKLDAVYGKSRASKDEISETSSVGEARRRETDAEKAEDEEESAAAKYQTEAVETLSTLSRVQISLPGLPPERTMMHWYELGLMRHSALISCLSKIHAIPEWYFNTQQAELPPYVKQTMTKPDANGPTSGKRAARVGSTSTSTSSSSSSSSS